MKKVVFIINSIQQQRCLKRIEAFIVHGYEVEAYGFSRDDIIPTLPKNFKINVLDYFDKKTSYIQRVIRMIKALRPIFQKYRNEDVLYYYFLLDVAMVCRLICNKPYIYEESDLMQTLLPKPICFVLNCIDKWLIKHSIISVFTSEGFLQYHYHQNPYPKNAYIIPNRLNPDILNYTIDKDIYDINHLRISFVGHIRYKSIIHFCEVVLTNFKRHQIHLYGGISEKQTEVERMNKLYPNLFLHGPFSNPKDLPSIYNKTDILFATYDIHDDNTRYAEPNKLYESAYFDTPIIVTKDTFLSQRVEYFGIGYAIDVWNDNEIIKLFTNLTNNDLNDKIAHCKAMDKKSLVDNYEGFFNLL